MQACIPIKSEEEISTDSKQHSLMEAVANFSLDTPKVTIRDIVFNEVLCVNPMVGHPFSNIRVTSLNEWQSTNTNVGVVAPTYKVDESFLYVFSAADKSELQNILRKNNSNCYPNVYVPHDKQFENVHNMFLIVEKRLQHFLKYCRDEKNLNDSFLNDIFIRIQKFTPFIFIINNFRGYIQYPFQWPIFYPSLEDELEAKMYMPPLCFGGAKQWVKNRYCDECGRIYFYKLERSRFCSERCRMRTVRKK